MGVGGDLGSPPSDVNCMTRMSYDIWDEPAKEEKTSNCAPVHTGTDLLGNDICEGEGVRVRMRV